MTPEEWLKVRGILEQALEVAPDRRADYLEQACSTDPQLRQEVESLIASSEQAGTDFLAGNALGAQAAGIADTPESLAGKKIGAYQIVEEIGRGGMGSVYRAIRADDQYRKRVAIKLMRGGLGDVLRLRRFKTERQILADLDHPNIARLLDGGTLEDGQPYVVMEYVQGRPIDEYCDAHSLAVKERLELFRTVCSAVAYAHQRLVIHRDLKPANILVTEDGEPKLLDFGIAKMLDVDQPEGGDPTVTVLRMMTPEYASPEQVRGEPVTTATDVYSLGVVLYGLLTGRKPYRVASRLPHEIAQAVCEAGPEKPSTSIERPAASGAELPPEKLSRMRGGSPDKLRRRLRGDLDNIVLKALRKEPERRYASVEQFSEDIRRHLAGLPVIARADTFLYRSGKFVKRHKAGVIAAALVALTLVAGLAITLRAAYIARVERARAERRFNDVRKLANSLLFEVHDAIQNLPGSTAARKLLVDRALQYLDALAGEARGNLPLQSELAAAYERVGDVQGGFREANLGDTSAALVSYRKALAIRQAVTAADPGNIEAQRELIRAHGKLSDLLLMSGDRAGAVQQSQQLVAIAEGLSSADPNNLAERLNLSTAYLDYGWKRAGPSGWKDALDDCRKAVSMLESVAAADPSARRPRRVLALAYSRTGELLSGYAHDHAASLAMHRKALALERSLLSQDPRNIDLRRIAGWEMLRTGDELSAQKGGAAALAPYRDALRELRALSAEDPNDAQARIQTAAATGRIGTALLQTGNARAALAELRNSLAECERYASPRSSNTDLLWVIALDQFYMGKAYALLASVAKAPAEARAENWRLAQQWYQRSLPNLEESGKRDLPGMAEDKLEDARRDLARSERELARLSARAR